MLLSYTVLWNVIVMSTLTSQLSISAKAGLLNLQRIMSGYDIGKWELINMLAESCNDDEIANIIMEYHKNKKEE